MKARVKETGEIVEVDQCSILYDDGRRELMYGKELEEVQGAHDYWEKLKHQYAGMAMQGLVARGEVLGSSVQEIARDIAEISCEVARALVEKLKESKV